jgi:hypothetical protein
VLADLVHYWKPLHQAVVRRPQRDYRQDRVPSSEPRDAGSLWNPAATAAIVAVTDWSAYLVRTLWREAPFEPAIDETTPTDIALATMARWHSRWFTHYPTLGPAWLNDALQLRTFAMKAMDAPGVKRIELRGQFCQQVLTETEYGEIRCRGQLVGILYSPDDERPSQIVCTANPNHPRLYSKEWILAHQP